MTDDTCQCSVFQALVTSLLQLRKNCWVHWMHSGWWSCPGYDNRESWGTAGSLLVRTSTPCHICARCVMPQFTARKKQWIYNRFSREVFSFFLVSASSAFSSLLQGCFTLQTWTLCIFPGMSHISLIIFIDIVIQLVSNIKLPYTPFPLNAVPVLYLIF